MPQKRKQDRGPKECVLSEREPWNDTQLTVFLFVLVRGEEINGVRANLPGKVAEGDRAFVDAAVCWSGDFSLWLKGQTDTGFPAGNAVGNHR